MTVDLAAGDLRHRISIQSRGTPTPDGEGGFTDVWESVDTVWSKVRPMRAKQVNEYRSINVHATHLIEVRGEVDVQESYRLVFGSRTFEVLTVEDEKEEGVKKWVVCKERRE